MEDTKKLYQERLTRLMTALRNEKPDRVPIQCMATYYVYTSQGIEPIEGFNDVAIAEKAHTDFYNPSRIYFDGHGGVRTSNKQHVSDIFRGGIYEFMPNGIHQVKPHSINVMEANEYDELIKSPHRFFAEKIWPRRFGLLAEEYSQEKYDKFTQVLKTNISSPKKNGPITSILENEYGLPCIFGGGCTNPVDIIFDQLRDFDGTIRDIKTRPEMVRDAGLAMVDWVLDMVTMRQPDPNKVLLAPMHIPTFLNPRDFEKVYFPSWKKLLEEVVKRGYRVVYLFEGNYEHLYEFIKELPKNGFGAVFEKDDLKLTKKKLGDNMCILGGMSTNLLANGTVQENIDHAKEIIDTVAVDGGFIFTSDIPMLFANDGTFENYRAVNEFVHEYGIYK